MAFDMFKPLGSWGKKAQAAGTNAGQSVADAFGIKAGQGAPIAIDFGTGCLKVLQVQMKDAMTPSLVAAACLQTPDDLVHDHLKRLEFQSEALPRLIRKGGFKGRRAVCAIPAWATVCRHLQIPRSEGLPLGELVGGALAMQLNIDPSAMVYRHIEVNSTAAGRSEVVCIAVGRDLVDRLMRAIAASKLDPVGMHSEFHSTLRCFDPSMLKEEGGGSTLYLDIGTLTTSVMIAQGEKIEFARVSSFGGRHMDEMIAKQLKVELTDAKRERRAMDEKLAAEPEKVLAEAARRRAMAAGAGAGPRPQGGATTAVAEPPGAVRKSASDFVAPQADLSEAIETIGDEVQMCLRYHAAQNPGRRVERVVFLGGEANQRGLCQEIARTLRLAARMADPMARVARAGNEPTTGVDLKQPQPAWSVALGMCLSRTDL